jgi:hypothetical protein
MLMLDIGVGFWESKEGLLERLNLLADNVQQGTFNKAVKIYATNVGATDFTISGDLTKNSCEWCIMHVGQSYHRGQFMPYLPKHPHCEHFYQVDRVGVETEESAFASFWELQ